MRVWTVAYRAPTIIEFQQLPAGAGVDPALAARAETWADLNLVRVAAFSLVSLALLPLVARVARAAIRAE